MSDEIKADYTSLQVTWVKFTGVCVEFRMLRDKWAFLSSQHYPTLPKIDETFRRITGLVEGLEGLFEKVGFSTHSIEDQEDFVEENIPSIIEEIRSRFLELCHYHGILKTTFYMRTVSSEIPHVVSGVPLSPEKTMGNEAIYLAADRVTERYKECLYIPSSFKWDGYVSFLYPMIGFYGAFCQPEKHMKIFHVSISEEGKNFLGLYLVLPHELSHICHCAIGSSGEIKEPEWFTRVFDSLSPILQSYYIPNWRQRIQQCLCDLLAMEIGGIATLQLFNDLIYFDLEQLLRNKFLYGYYTHNNDPLATLIGEEIEILNHRWQTIYESGNHQGIVNLGEVGENLGFRFGEIQQSFVSNENRQELDLPSENTIGTDLIAHLVNPRERFRITIEEEKEVCWKLQNGEIVCDIDSRKILHGYYQNIRIHSPNVYNAILFSLVNNTS